MGHTRRDAWLFLRRSPKPWLASLPRRNAGGRSCPSSLLEFRTSGDTRRARASLYPCQCRGGTLQRSTGPGWYPGGDVLVPPFLIAFIPVVESELPEAVQVHPFLADGVWARIIHPCVRG